MPLHSRQVWGGMVDSVSGTMMPCPLMIHKMWVISLWHEGREGNFTMMMGKEEAIGVTEEIGEMKGSDAGALR